VKAKRAKKVHFWISYRLPGGKQKRESIGFSIEEAKDAEGKRRSQKRENRIFDIKPEAKMSFNELTEWYTNLESVKAKTYFPTLNHNLNSFNSDFGNMVVNQLQPIDLENFQVKQKAKGFSDSYVDQQVGAARTMINKAFDNNLVSGDTLRIFKKVKKLLKRNANARDRILSKDEFNSLLDQLPSHTKAILITAFYTGMRRGEILSLTWDKVDLKNRVIRLTSEDTKDKEPRVIPIGESLYTVLQSMPKAIHTNHVFLFKGKPVKDIRTSLYRACKDIGIQTGRAEKNGFVFHDLRHTFNTYMRKAGISESVIMGISGHSTREMFDRYNTIDRQDKRQAVDQMQAFIASVDQNVDQVPSCQ
jgi:integrase